MLSQPTQNDEDANQVQCPRCQGQGVLKQWHGDRSPEQDCDYCDGKTVVTEARCREFFESRK